MVFAGPVFTEWYWGPIFFAVVFGPPLLAVAFVADFAVRRWVRPLRGLRRAALGAGVVAAGTLAILGGRALVEHVRFERESRAAAQDFDFTPFAARRLPAGFHARLVKAPADDPPVLIGLYDVRPAGHASGYQQRAGAVTLEPGRCSLTRLAGTGTTFYEGACEERRTPTGRRVFVGPSRAIVDGREAFAVLDGTLVRLQSSGVPQGAVLGWFDALEPVRPADIDWKGP